MGGGRFRRPVNTEGGEWRTGVECGAEATSTAIVNDGPVMTKRATSKRRRQAEAGVGPTATPAGHAWCRPGSLGCTGTW